jgi:hypothetical protein
MFGSYSATLYRIVADFSRDIVPLLATAALQMAVNLRVKTADSFSPFYLREIKSCITYILFWMSKLKKQCLLIPELKRFELYLRCRSLDNEDDIARSLLRHGKNKKITIFMGLIIHSYGYFECFERF